MFYLRMGPRFLFIRTKAIDEMKSFLISRLGGKITSFHDGMNLATESSTFCFLTDTQPVKTSLEDVKEIILINEVASICLVEIVNSHINELVHRIDMGPASMVMRIAGDEGKIVDILKEEYQGQLVDWIEGIRLGEKGDTLLALTNKPINGPLNETDFLQPNLLLPYNAGYIQKRLRIEGLRFITQSLESGEWYEFRINIYDSYGKYKENYKRLVFILTKLEIGMILGESWTRDHALLLYSVLAFQVRLFTFYTPVEIKKVLMALEYTLDGKRLVDYDLYYRNKKVSWVDIEKVKGKRNKVEESQKYRRQLLERLSKEDTKQLTNMEEELLKSLV
ncbi:hypothetical protein F8154_00265 [Alkaliphilus pronyensis]|uniref:Uncharacterized protein n=1 Tax=Alkaliphilus pronyensis TaxID=1482732 RepID=A0A6I0FPN7_9FIRM|nr:hypothetical protein [Alkaliphilus pronyensis]KAB3540987.1 hypothetical protein F8154_00265 [Alkaliphilus pronyensis]